MNNQSEVQNYTEIQTSYGVGKGSTEGQKAFNLQSPLHQPNEADIIKEAHSPGSPKSNMTLEKETITFSQKDFKKIDVSWEHLNIQALINKKVIVNGKKKTVKETKIILNNISGAVKNGRFTAIMGPSGSGKTTLLDFLSARISGKGLKINGAIKVNGHPISSLESISSAVAYVMQDDILLATITPREAFMFIANLRLKESHAEKKKRVEEMLHDLGLTDVANTKVGSNLIRGLSGGERKRTSIGVELITNPSMLFLDEPTTGLDSKTAQKVITLLVNLAQKGGRTVVSTIHQPSSQIFGLFDELLLLVRGNIIYQGKSNLAVNYFGSIGYECPKLTNPADHFMKIMNESGVLLEMMERDQSQNASHNALQMTQDQIEEKFVQRLEQYNKSYAQSGMYEQALSGLATEVVDTKDHSTVAWLKQLWYIFARKCRDEARNRMGMKVKIIQNLIFAAIIMLVFNHLGTAQAGIQNRNGVLFFCVVMSYMGGVQGSIGTFSGERPIFIRERLNKSYATSAYFWAKAAAELPLLVAQPTVLVATSYYVIGLNNPAYKYFILIAITICTTLAGSGFGLVISTFIPTMELAVAMTPILMLPTILFAGLFVGQDKIPYYFYEFQYISPVKYAFQAVVQNEFRDFDICGGCDPLANLGRHQGVALSIGILLIIAFCSRVIAYLGLISISTPKKARVLPPQDTYDAFNPSNSSSKSKGHNLK